MYCRHCGSEVSSVDSNCGSCGAPVMQAEMKYCSNCGRQIARSAYICPDCGERQEIFNPEPEPSYSKAYDEPTPVVNINNTYVNSAPQGEAKNKWVTFLLCLFLGTLGIHKFYEGKVGMGVLYIFTLGLFGFGVIIDLIVVVMKPSTYYV